MGFIKKVNTTNYIPILKITILFSLLFILSRFNYLLFHTGIELFSVTISFSVFIISTFTYDREKNAFSLLGIGYLSVGILDILHTLSYQGMNVFSGDIFYANQIWICARFVEAITILFFALHNKLIYKKFRVFLSLHLIFIVGIILSVFYFKNFPTCFIPNEGQTRFKIIIEYIIIFILLISLLVLNKKSYLAKKKIKRLISFSIIFTIIGELAFTLYSDNYGVLNVFGHLFKTISFYFIYKSILIVNVQNPLELIFEELNNKDKKIVKLLSQLKEEKNRAVKCSLTDGLTGVPNRRFFDQIISEKFASLKRNRGSISLFMIDIDFFKKYNDFYGHVEGDECLKKVAKALENCLSRANDMIARYGGEEFIVVLENTDLNGSIKLAREMREEVLKLKIPHEKSTCNSYVTVSIGVFNTENLQRGSFEDLVKNADLALYRAKDRGRNMVETI